MKKLLPSSALFLLLLLLGTVSCKKILGLLTFQVNDSTTFQLPATPPGPLPNPVITLPAVVVNSTANSTYQNNNTSGDYVQDVTLNRLALTITDPTGQNFDFVQRIRVYISTDATGAGKLLLASLDPVPAGQTTIELKPADQKLDVFLRGNPYYLFTTVELTPLGLRNITTVRADSRFNIKANPK